MRLVWEKARESVRGACFARFERHSDARPQLGWGSPLQPNHATALILMPIFQMVDVKR